MWEIMNVLEILRLVQSGIQNKQNKKLSIYNIKKETYLLVKRYLEKPFEKRTAYGRILNYDTPLCVLRKEELEGLQLNIEKIFSSDTYIKYCEIMKILEELKKNR